MKVGDKVRIASVPGRVLYVCPHDGCTAVVQWSNDTISTVLRELLVVKKD